MRNKILTGIAAGFIAAVGVAAPAQAISPTTADLYVLHAVPGLTVDVWVNGEVLLEDFAPGTLTNPLDLAAGDYEVVITAADDPITSPAIGPVTLSLAANTSYTAVAHLAADGSPTATLFTNDLATIPAGQGKLTVRHTAAAPAVDILANGVAAFTNLENPNEVKADLPAGTISAAVAATGTTEPVIGPADVAIQEGVNTIVYAWGSLEDDNLDLAVQTITGLHSAPDGVNSGTGGQLAQRDMTMQLLMLLGGVAIAAAVATSAVAVARARAQR